MAIIPARGGSQRIPRKNIREFAGTPMIAHSIGVALASGCFDRVVVSTDDEEIAAVAVAHGAEVPFTRPAELADAHTGTIAVIQHAVRELDTEDLEFACCLYATAPFVTAELLRRGHDVLKESGASYAFTVAAYAAPIQRALRLREDGRLDPFWPENVPARSQDLEPAFHDAGQFYWGTADAWRQARQIHSASSVPVLLPAYRVQDIDTTDDWVRAELLYALLQQESAP